MVRITITPEVIMHTKDDIIEFSCPVVTQPPTPKLNIAFTLAAVNMTTTDTDATIQKWGNAIKKQADRDISKYWGYSINIVNIKKGDPIPTSDAYAGFFDDTDTPGAAAWHDAGPNGEPLIKVFTRLTEASGQSPSISYSHEVAESISDTNAVTLVKGFDEAGTPCTYYQENCDPVEALSYQIDGVEVSDFVTPQWFLETGKGLLDFMGACTKPYEILSGGYMQVSYDHGATWTEINKASKRAAMHQSEHSRYALYKKPLKERVRSTFVTV